MNINFTGLSNMCGVSMKLQRVSPVETDLQDISERTYMNIQFKDDKYGNDLSELRKYLETTDLKRKLNPINPEYLNIAAFNTTVRNEHIVRTSQILYINDVVPININDKNLKFFTYLASLMKKIQEIPQSDIMVDKEFLHGNLTQRILFLDPINKPNISQFIPAIFTHDNISLRAKEVSAILQTRMMKYFKL